LLDYTSDPYMETKSKISKQRLAQLSKQSKLSQSAMTYVS
jgi:hypothetical protein